MYVFVGWGWGQDGNPGVWLGPQQDSQQWALTFQCGFIVLYMCLKGHCVSIGILLLFMEESYPVETPLNMGTPDGLGTHSQLMPRVSVGLLSVPSVTGCHGGPFISLTFTADLH